MEIDLRASVRGQRSGWRQTRAARQCRELSKDRGRDEYPRRDPRRRPSRQPGREVEIASPPDVTELRLQVDRRLLAGHGAIGRALWRWLGGAWHGRRDLYRSRDDAADA